MLESDDSISIRASNFASAAGGCSAGGVCIAIATHDQDLVTTSAAAASAAASSTGGDRSAADSVNAQPLVSDMHEVGAPSLLNDIKIIQLCTYTGKAFYNEHNLKC